MAEHWQAPNLSQRLPGEQWLVLDSVQTAEVYLNALTECRVEWEVYPNPEGLYARIRFPGRVLQNRIYVPPVSE